MNNKEQLQLIDDWKQISTYMLYIALKPQWKKQHKRKKNKHSVALLFFAFYQ